MARLESTEPIAQSYYTHDGMGGKCRSSFLYFAQSLCV